jgi:hypothetical protein
MRGPNRHTRSLVRPEKAGKGFEKNAWRNGGDAMKLAPLGAVLAFSACASAPRAEASGPFYRLVDLTGAYAAFFDRTRGMPPADRVAAFRADMQPRFPGFYDSARLGGPSREGALNRRIARSFDDFPKQREGYTGAGARFARVLDPALASFRQVMSDMAPLGDVYLLNSLGEMDGGTRAFGGQLYFIFGADMIARYHPPGTERPFFHHELFHIYQGQFFGRCDLIWCDLWTEGTAVLAAAELNPAATDEQLLLNLPEPIRAKTDANFTEAVCAVRSRLESTSDAAGAALFNFDRLNADLPPRFGYYVGYRLAQAVRRTHSLKEIAHMNQTQARAALEAGLTTLATCP